LIEREDGSVDVVDNSLFLCSRADFDTWAVDRSTPYRHEEFYRFMRRKTDYLMDGDRPVGGTWNFDRENREFPGRKHEPPDPPYFPPDDLTRDVAEWVDETFDGSYDGPPYGGDWANPESFRWPVTREDALAMLDGFVEERLTAFGPYQDAMLDGEWAMYHALLSPALNLGLLHPAEAVEAVIAAGESDPDIPLNSVEGFVRQIIGWREFVRHVYRTTMPDLADANQLDADADLPEWYWTGETDMACLSDTIASVRKRGYSHHVQRLMLLSNFALLYGVDPRQLDRWFHAGYVDAYHWVTTPNVVEMGSYGAGVFATKPYATSANYISRMSDYCPNCPYNPDETTGDEACPFNALYWDFLDRNEAELRRNPRMALMYSHLDDANRQAIRDRVRTLRRMEKDGEL
jgi:deoxyribodipyrimidine photolyase-related protein